MLRPTMISEIVRRRNEDQRHRIANPYRDHVPLKPLCMPDAAVETFGDDINEAVIDHQLDQDIGTVARQRRQSRHDEVDGSGAMGIDPHAPRRMLACPIKQTQHFLDRRHGGSQSQEQRFAGAGRCQRTGRAIEQSQIQLPFQHAHRMAERGGRKAKPRRCLGEAARLHDFPEYREARPEIAIHI